MRITFSLLFLFIFTQSYPVENPDSTKAKLIFNGNVSINSNGMAPIPSFSLGKPAIIASFALSKKRFSYDPSVAYGLNFRPWIIDNWLHYRIIFKPSFELRTGMDFSMFFSESTAGDYDILQGQQYLTFEIAAVFKFEKESSLSLMYWNDNGQDHGSISGHFVNLVYDRAGIRIGRYLLLSANVQFFYIDYTANNDGLFISPRIASGIKDIPFSVFLQVTQALNSNIEPFPAFRWNVGIGWSF